MPGGVGVLGIYGTVEAMVALEQMCSVWEAV